MTNKPFRVIDPIATGANIVRLRKERGLTVRDLQTYFGFEEPQAIYKWQRGQSLPTVDNLYALGALLDVPLEGILVQATPKLNLIHCEQQAQAACCSSFVGGEPREYGRDRKRPPSFSQTCGIPIRKHAVRKKRPEGLSILLWMLFPHPSRQRSEEGMRVGSV